MRYVVAIQFTLHVLPEHKPVHHHTWGAVLMAACEAELCFPVLLGLEEQTCRRSDVSQLLQTSRLPAPTLGSASLWSSGLPTSRGGSAWARSC